ncbi:BolA family protein [Loktanella sp. M215]|uniref:BolA family protein n=1 Tax=Loktanella sp. M215 TaxID=2675431 RepID=UPI001F3A74EE|nr:BolA family protein [Loktanella sp. M215]MBU2357956.1 BolA family transcriptional regulator [Alphaproteobacteria bacterium]MCF7699787.1 BolA/IbaG family iron-sulfur metabolism protein [Loktanella sp. M215]
MALDADIRDALTRGLSPEHLEVINESHLHAGHSGDDGSGESHWQVVIGAASLDGKSRLAKHRAVHDALGPDIIDRLHALAITFR